jgi:hypothetical protein
MSTSSSYCTLADAKIAAEIPIDDTSRDSVIARLIPHVSRHIDTYCHRFFYPKTATEVYDYQGEWKLWLRGDLQSLTSITNGDGTLLDVSTIFKYPMIGPPYQWLEINRSGSATFRWAPTTNQQCISVVGSWGFLEDGETPENIVDGCTAWITYLLKVGKLAGVKSTTIGDYSVSYSSVLDVLRNGPPNEAGNYLDYYVKRRFATTNKDVAP